MDSLVLKTFLLRAFLFFLLSPGVLFTLGPFRGAKLATVVVHAILFATIVQFLYPFFELVESEAEGYQDTPLKATCEGRKKGICCAGGEIKVRGSRVVCKIREGTCNEDGICV